MTSWDLGGEGNSFPFDRIGDKVYGMVIDLNDRQQTDMEGTPTAGQPSTWPNGDPKMMSIVTLQTELRESPTDDGKRTVPLTGSKKPETQSRMAAVVGAVKAATNGSTALQYGGYLGIAFTGEKPPTTRGMSATKLYDAIYRPPAMEIDKPVPQQQAAPPQAAPQQNAQQGWQSQGAGPAWAQQEPPTPDPWGGQQETLSQPVDNGAWGSQQQQQAQNPWAGAPSNDPWAVPAPAQQQPASNQWNPAQQGNPGPSPAQGQAAPPAASAPQQGQQPPSAQNGGQTPPPTASQIAGLQAIKIDPASVYGPDWQSRVVPG